MALNGDAPLLSARDVFKIYREGSVETVALRGASLDVHAGELVSLLGPSGSGKSTLLSIAAGLALPSAGQVVLDGRDITRLGEPERARVRANDVGIVFQRGNLIPHLTAEENVALAGQARGNRAATERARDLLADVGLGERRDHYPRQLSGGEAQRVGVAVALANDPRLVLGDEITGELDSATAERILELLLRERERRGLCMVLVTHDPAVAKIADRRLAMSDGVVRAQ